MPLKFHDEIRVCTDCVQLIVNGEGEDSKAEEIATRYPLSHYFIGIADESDGHGINACQACGEKLHGERYKATVYLKTLEKNPEENIRRKSMTYGVLPDLRDFNHNFNVGCPDGMFSFGNDKRVGSVELTRRELWVELRKAVKEFNRGKESAGDWASCVLSVLGFEWV